MIINNFIALWLPHMSIIDTLDECWKRIHHLIGSLIIAAFYERLFFFFFSAHIFVCVLFFSINAYFVMGKSDSFRHILLSGWEREREMSSMTTCRTMRYSLGRNFQREIFNFFFFVVYFCILLLFDFKNTEKFR